MARPPRSDLPDQRRAQLLTLGKRIFSARAYDAVSTEYIADEGDISVGLLYHYFGSKKGFYVATIRAAADEVLAATRFPPEQAFGAAAVAALTGFLDFVESNSLLYQGLMRGGVGADTEVHTILEEVRATLLARLLDAAGVVPDASLRFRTYAWIGYTEFATLRWLQHREVSRAELLGIVVGALPAPLLSQLEV